jgi:hypothetical protein
LLARAEHRGEKIAFAEETMQEVKVRTAKMKQSIGVRCLTTRR